MGAVYFFRPDNVLTDDDRLLDWFGRTSEALAAAG